VFLKIGLPKPLDIKILQCLTTVKTVYPRNFGNRYKFKNDPDSWNYCLSSPDREHAGNADVNVKRHHDKLRIITEN
jgi:hypothetical protein